MPSKIEQYNAAKIDQSRCLSWSSLIGSPYRGGGGGVGTLQPLKLPDFVVYHQYSDGDKNYHVMPAALEKHLEAVIKERFSELLADALTRQDVALMLSAAEALVEHDDLMRAAGLMP